MLGSRARSASDAAVLRRKGHLKEQDRFISFLLDMHHTHTSLEVGGRAGGRAGGQRRTAGQRKVGSAESTLARGVLVWGGV